MKGVKELYAGRRVAVRVETTDSWKEKMDRREDKKIASQDENGDSWEEEKVYSREEKIDNGRKRKIAGRMEKKDRW